MMRYNNLHGNFSIKKNLRVKSHFLLDCISSWRADNSTKFATTSMIHAGQFGEII